MTWFKRNKGLKSLPIPKYAAETPEQSLKHIRTHIAAQAGELSNLRVQLGQIADQLDQVHLVTVRQRKEGVTPRG